jgi:hypothetical protein
VLLTPADGGVAESAALRWSSDVTPIEDDDGVTVRDVVGVENGLGRVSWNESEC